MSLFNLLAPGFATFYKHPNFSSADDVIPDLKGKVAIVTGGTGGLGLETALQLAKKGAKVYVAGRSTQKGAAAVEKIRSATGASDQNVQFMELDLADIKKTKAAAETFLATSQQLNILVNNAGFMDFAFSLTPRDKLESHIAVEVAHIVFTTTLFPAIRNAGPGARIVNVTSHGHVRIKQPVNWERLCSPEGEIELQPGLSRYGGAKIAGIYSTMHLQRALADEDIYVNCCHPGPAISDFSRDVRATLGKMSFLLWILESLFYQTVEVGALTQLYLAASPEVESKGIKGQYLWPVAKVCPEKASALAWDEKEQERYWNWAKGVADKAMKRAD